MKNAQATPIAKKKVVYSIVIVVLILCIAAAIVLPIVLLRKSDKTLADLKKETILEQTDFAEEYVDSFDSQNLALFYERRATMSSLVSVNDLNLPETLTAKGNDQEFGLYLYNGTTFVRYNEAQATDVDPNKKTLIHAHGMGKNGNWDNYRGYYEKGYNVLCLHWGAFADEDFGSFKTICDKVWTYNSPMRYHSSDGNGWMDGTDIQYSMAEIYAACYLDFLSKFPSVTEREIVMTGHSYGGMLTTALLSYLTTAFENGLLEAKCLPDRAILCDPFFVDGDEGYNIRWLGDTKNDYYGGSIFLSKQALIAAHALGISVALVRSSGLITTAFAIAYDIPDISEGLDSINRELLYIDGDALPMFKMLLKIQEVPSAAHMYGEVWPAMMTKEVFDSQNENEYAFSVFNPYHANFARAKTTYYLDYNRTPENFDDDFITLSKGPDGKKIYGFAFEDRNKNGVMDERLDSHVMDVTVTLTDASGNKQTARTGINGYYEFLVNTPGEYTLSFSAPNGYSLSQKKASVTVTENSRFLYAPVPVLRR